MNAFYDSDMLKKTFVGTIAINSLVLLLEYFNLLKNRIRKVDSTPLILRIKGYISNNTFIGKVFNLTCIGLQRYTNKYILDKIVDFNQRNSFHRIRYITKGVYYGAIISYVLNEFFYRNGKRPYFLSEHYKTQVYLNTDICHSFIYEYQKESILTDLVNKEIEYKFNISRGISDQKWLNKKQDSYMIIDKNLNYKPLDYDSLFTEIDFLQIGKFMSSINQYEIANQAFYIAYLKNNDLGFNSDAKVEI